MGHFGVGFMNGPDVKMGRYFKLHGVTEILKNFLHKRKKQEKVLS